MKHRIFGRKIVYGILVLIVYGILMLIGQSGAGVKKNDDLIDQGEIVFFGDSLIANGRGDDTSVAEKLADLTGVSVFNAALGGTGLGYKDSDERIAYTKDSFNMIGLTQSILTRDFRIQKNARILEPGTEYFGTVIFWMDHMDFQAADTVLIQQALNDYHAGVPVENEDDPYDARSYAGAMRTVIARLRKIKPEYRIILVSPTYTWYPDRNLNCEDFVINGQILEDFVIKQSELAEELDLEFIDLYHGFYEHENEDDWMKYTTDGMHPTEASRGLIAEQIAKYLKENGK